jgi:hypothetical protein
METVKNTVGHLFGGNKENVSKSRSIYLKPLTDQSHTQSSEGHR